MPKRTQIPPRLSRTPFDTATGFAKGLTLGELRSGQWQRSFHGVRSIGLDLADFEHRCRAHQTRMSALGMFSHETAARLWKLPLPLSFGDQLLHVTVPTPARAPRGSGIRGHRSWSATPRLLRGLRVTDAVDSWLDLAGQLSIPDLVAIGDFLVTGDPYNDVLPLATMEELAVAVSARRGSAGYRKQSAALARVKEGPLSRPETLVRLILEDARLPQPLINQTVNDARGSFLAMPDLIWPEWKVALEYEGDVHRDKTRFRKDIRRVERLVDHGWLVIKVSADDLFDLPADLVARVARRLVSRGWPCTSIRLPQSVQFRR